MTKGIQYAKARNPSTHELTDWLNGDRLVYVEDFDTPLQRTATISSSNVRIFHEGQDIQLKQTLCTKCFGTDHMRSKCQKPEDWCRLCQCAGHKAGQAGCGSITDRPQEDVRTIYGYRDLLRSHYSASICVFGQTITLAEQAYKYTQAINAKKPEIAEDIMKAPMLGKSNSLPATSPTTLPGNSVSRE